jgi:hypothetical protein
MVAVITINRDQLEEAVFADVHDGVTNFGRGNIVKCAVAIDVYAIAWGTATHRSDVARGATWHRSAWHPSVTPGRGKGKFDAQVLYLLIINNNRCLFRSKIY